MSLPLTLLAHVSGFQWDDGNSGKNWIKHRVSDEEAEEIFVNLPLLLLPDFEHSPRETRYIAFGRTDSARSLFVAFAIRQNQIRVISARDMTSRERVRYSRV